MALLQLSDIRKKFLFHINYGLSAFRIFDIIGDKTLDYELDFDVYLPTKGMNLQRAFVWNLFQKQQLILSMLKGIQIPLMTFINYEHKIFKVIDGKQRLNAMITFCKNEFPIKYNGNEYYFKDLDSWAKREIEYVFIKADVGYEYKEKLISDDIKIQWFEMINFAGTPQDIKHLNNLKKS